MTSSRRLAALLLVISTQAASSLVLRESQDRPVRLYNAPTPYYRLGKSPLSSVIITSQPMDFNSTATAHNHSNSNNSTINDTQWRRQSSDDQGDVSPASLTQTKWGHQPSEDSGPTLPPAHGKIPEFITNSRRFGDSKTSQPAKQAVNIPFYNLDCRKGEACSETINLEISTQAPTFKPYPQELLDKFLKEYNDKQRQSEGNQEEPDKPRPVTTRFNDRELIDPAVEPTNRLANLYLESDATPAWDLVPSEKHNHPYDDREGWITLEPVPWSSSKVSKWHSQNKPGSGKRPHHAARPPRPWDPKPSSDDYDKPSKPWESHNHWETKPSKPWDNDKPSRPWDNDKPSRPWDNDKPSRPWDNDKPSRPWDNDKPSRPWDNDKPSKPWDNEKPSKPWENERPSRPWENEKPQKPNWDDDKPSRPWDRPEKPLQWASSSDIITADNQHSHWEKPSYSKPSSDWPSQSLYTDIITAENQHNQYGNKPHDGYHHHQSHHQSHHLSHHQHHPSPTSWPRPHPSTHPDGGPGEWVLLSSTKGYSLPSRSKTRQRALTFVTGMPINARRSVRLTVLPGDAANMTTSHSGMIEVEKTHQSVDEAHEENLKLQQQHQAEIEAYKSQHLQAEMEAYKSQQLQSEKEVTEVFAADKNNNTEPSVSAQQVVAPAQAPGTFVSQGTTTFVRSRDNQKTATLAAVGAGMLPATMALLVPMIMGRKKRDVVRPTLHDRVNITF